MFEIDFQWDLTEENFLRMMAEEQTTDIFGSLRFGEYLIEFRCTGGGYDDDYHIPTTDIYIYGESGPEEYSLSDGTPYKLLDEEIFVPKRRTLAGFRYRIESMVCERLTDEESEIVDDKVYSRTRTAKEWEV